MGDGSSSVLQFGPGLARVEPFRGRVALLRGAGQGPDDATQQWGCPFRFAPNRMNAAMALGNPHKRKTPLGVLVMLSALVVSAFLGAAVGLVFQKSGLFDDEVEDEVLTVDRPGG